MLVVTMLRIFIRSDIAADKKICR